MPPKKKAKRKTISRPKRPKERIRRTNVMQWIIDKTNRYSKCPYTETLIGPYQMDILDRKQDDARVVLLSDYHEFKTKCDEKITCPNGIVSYLNTLFTQYRGSVDINFFLEIEFDESIRGLEQFKKFSTVKAAILRGENFNRSYLVILRIFFEDCFQRVKQKCQFYGKPIKFHYADVRGGVLHSKTDKESETAIKELKELNRVTYNSETPAPKHFAILERFIQRFKNKDVDFFFKLTKIDKQFREILRHNPEKEYILDALRNLMVSHINSPEIIQRMNITEYFVMRQEVPPGFDFSPLRASITACLFSPLFDIYTMARIIKHDMKQVIIYAGGAHIEQIREFLLSYMNYQVTVSRESKEQGKNFQCISLKGTPQPWFV